ncbi:hypothetical protein JCM33374_g2732 [Metschnikowia sp. JCM 33374]|nr:hypothetical protein JCM33374_g2732 [Metschnikowia sp. JCM 33374]
MASTLDMKALNVFIQTPVTQDMVHKLVVATLQVIQCQDDKFTKSSSGGKALPSLMSFINKLVKYTNVYTGTLMATLVLLDRLKSKLPHNAQGLSCTRHRVFLSCLILASKFHNDSSPKNVHWAKYTDGLFSLKDVNLMERQLLFLLDWNVKVSNEEMVSHLHKFLSPIKEDLVNAAKMRKFLYAQQKATSSRLQTQTQTQAQAKSHVHSDTSLRSTISRSSSATSSLSLTRESPISPANSDGSRYHVRQSSCSSVESVSPMMAQKAHRWNLQINPHIEMVARSEEQELTKMLHQLGQRTHTN